MTPPPPPARPKTCLATVGATAPFPALTAAVLSPPFRAALLKHNYTHLVVQTGPASSPPSPASPPRSPSFIPPSPPSPARSAPSPTTPNAPSPDAPSPAELEITTFALAPDMSPHIARASLIISHCGAGSVLEALRHGGDARLVVVPNPALMDGHQDELAAVLEGGGYCVWGRLGGAAEEGRGLVEALERVEGERKAEEEGEGRERFPGPGEGVGGLLEEEMGLVGLD
ncbi:hypothetical protein EDC01DRAFT_786384 [Geopyxis carbonaria]|nr:hypothetical protein EDC01DRAFT_786384 [Geopyxis carbonaria]